MRSTIVMLPAVALAQVVFGALALGQDLTPAAAEAAGSVASQPPVPTVSPVAAEGAGDPVSASTTSADPAPTPTAAGPPVVAADAGATAGDRSNENASATTTPADNFKVPPGFVEVKRGSDVVYCTRRVPSGSHLSQPVCMTRDQIIVQKQKMERDRKALMDRAGNCGGYGPVACGGG